MTWSPQQEAIFSASKSGDSLIVIAVAGSGKTTTGVEAARRLHPPKRTAMTFLAFNKKIASELEERLPQYCVAKTLNAYGFSTLRGRRRNVKVDPEKVKKIVANAPDLFPIQRLVSAAKNFVFYEPSYEDMKDLADYLGLEPEDEETMIFTAMDALEQSRKDVETIDFDDQLYIPVIDQIRGPAQKAILVDEVQDLSLMQIEFLKLISDENTQIIGFGDPNQAIYKFRGADNEACTRFTDEYNLSGLPLSVSYRCPTEVVAEAQEFVPRIEAAEGAPRGSVGVIDKLDYTDLPSDALFLARANGPVIRAAQKRLKHRQASNVLGRFPRQLQGFIGSFKKKRVDELKPALQDYLQSVENDYGKDSRRFGMATDKVDCVYALAADCTSVADLKNNLSEIGQCTAGPKLSTVHQAKGLEEKNVYFHHPKYISDPNILYVGITRSLDKLTYIGDAPGDD